MFMWLKRIFLIIFLFTFITNVNADFPPTQIYDEGTKQGVFFNLDCTGAGISCTQSGITGTLSVAGGAGGGWTDDGARVRLTTVSDNVGIGRSNPSAKLHIFGAGTGTGFALIVSDTTPADRLVVLDNGNVGIGLTNPSQKLEISGNLLVSGTGTFNILSITNAIDISSQTNLAVTAPVVLTNDTLSLTVAKDIVAGVGLSGGEDNILPGADADTTLTLDLTEISSLTWGAGAFTTMTFDAGATDPVLTTKSNSLNLSTGNLGVGNTAPQALLDVGTSPGTGLIVLGGGNVGIGTTNPTTSLHIIGDITIIGDNIEATTETDRFVWMANGSTYAPEAINLGTDTTGNYAAGDAEAGAALTGDSATSFFSTGTLEVAIGGTGATTSTGTGSLVLGTSPTFTTKIISPEVENSGNITIDAISATAASTVAIQNSDATYTANLTIDGDLTITGGDITLGTTSIFSGGDTASLNNIDAIDSTTETTLEAAVDIAGDVSGTGLGSVAIGANKITEAMLKAVDTAADEEFLTYETTTGDFEWQTGGNTITWRSTDAASLNLATQGDVAYTDLDLTSVTSASAKGVFLTITISNSTANEYVELGLRKNGITPTYGSYFAAPDALGANTGALYFMGIVACDTDQIIEYTINTETSATCGVVIAVEGYWE